MGLWDSRLFWPPESKPANDKEPGSEMYDFGWSLPLSEPAEGYDPSAEVPDIPTAERA